MNVRREKVKWRLLQAGRNPGKCFLFSFPCFIEILPDVWEMPPMLMMCWFYCIPFAKGLFFASAFLLIIFSLFVLKRGVRQSRPLLRQLSFLLIFIAILKIFTVDIYLLRDNLLCGAGLFKSSCNAQGFKILQASGLAALLLCSLLLLNLYRSFIRERKRREITPEQNHLRLWSNLGMFLVMLLVLWLAAPWVGFLTVGHVPKLFMNVPWQHLAVLDTVVLLIGFWKLEDCLWIYDPAEKNKKKYISRVWTPKDTLGLSVILFLITLAFSYASNDVLSTSRPSEKSHFQMDEIDLGGFGLGFHLPGK
jgi:hypothetical protein